MALKGFIKNGNKMEEVCVSDVIPVGLMFPFSSNGAIPAGFLLCNGASVLRSTYPDLFAVIGTTWGAVDNLHFNLPDSRNLFPEGSTVAGTYKQAGLPNITGEFAGAENQNNYFKGAFYLISEDTTSAISNSGDGDDLYGFDASRSSSIYGRSDTVQPASFTVRWIIKAFRGVSDDAKDVAIAEVLNGIARVTNAVAKIGDAKDSIIETFKQGGSWYRLYNSGWVEQGCVYDNGSDARSIGGIVNWLVPFANVEYTQLITPERGNDGNHCVQIGTKNKTPNNIHVSLYGTGSSDYSRYIQCMACGYARSEDAPTYTLKVTRYETRYQTITITVNNVVYMNEQELTVHENDVIIITTGGNWSYSGDVIVNGVNQGTRTVRLSANQNLTITTTQPYDDGDS